MTYPVCIFGAPAAARELADLLLSRGRRVMIAPAPGDVPLEGEGTTGMEVLPPVRMLACTGGPGEFELVFARDGDVLRRRASALVLAHPPERRPLYDAYGLRPAPAVLSASRLIDLGCRPPAGAAWDAVAVLNGLQTESTPQTTGALLRAVLRLRAETHARCHYFTRNLKVAADGLETLAHEAREAGVVFHKFTYSRPSIAQDEHGRTTLTFTDEVTGVDFRLTPDLLVVDEAPEPSAAIRELARTLELETDAAGFPQADNVHRLPVFTNRRGVLVAGWALPYGAAGAADAANLLLALRPGSNPNAAQIDPGRCVRCLTCYRVCPYRAVALNGRPAVQPAACEACGICRAECPRRAIRIAGLEPADIRDLIDSGRPAPGGGPFVVAFACARSAGPALRSAAAAGHCWAAHVNLIEVPCAGALGPDAILSAFERGADGVMVLTCHDDNCHSRTGNRLARSRTEHAQSFLERYGLAGRLTHLTVAANMEAELDRALSEFAAHLAAADRAEPQVTG